MLSLTLSAQAAEGKPSEQSRQAKSVVDHAAKVYNLEGNVKILSRNQANWVMVTKKTVVREGDQIRTGKAAFVEIYYDNFFLNIVRIGADTIADFRSIEPTDVFLSDGRIFSALDGLPKGSTYEVATPTSVAGVRGTHFMREHNAETNESNTFVTEGEVELFMFDPSGEVVATETL